MYMYMHMYTYTYMYIVHVPRFCMFLQAFKYVATDVKIEWILSCLYGNKIKELSIKQSFSAGRFYVMLEALSQDENKVC